MIKTSAAALLLSATILTGAAVAQAPATTAPMSTTAPAGGKFMTEQATGEFRASKFVGLDVYGSDNEKIGDISEVLIDGQGNAKAVVVGVGGFLGIGQKNVAVPWSAVTWSNDRPPARAASNAAPATTGSTAPVTGAAPMTGGTPPTVATAPARSPAEQAAYNGYPDHAVVKLSKAELQDAPAFKYYSETHSSTGAPSNATAPATSRP